MSAIRDRLGITNNSASSIRDRLGISNSSDDFRKQYIKDYSDYKKKSSSLKELATSRDIETTIAGSSLISTKSPFKNKIDIQKNTIQNNKFKVDDYDLETRKNRINLNNLKKTDEYKNIQQETEKAFNKQKVSNYNYEAQKIAEDNVNFWDKTGGNVTRALTGLFDMGGYELTDEYGEKYNVPSLTQLKQQKVSQSYNTKLGKFLGDTAHEITKIGVTTAINTVAPGVGTGLYFGDMYFDSKNSALQEGYDEKSATVYAISNVGLEYATGKLLGSATKGLTGGKSSNYEELLNKTFNKLTKNSTLSNILANAGSEATEEFLQEYMDNISKLAILDKNTNVKDYLSVFTDKEILADALYSAAIGGVTGGVIGTLSGQDTNVDNNDVNLYDNFKKELEETKQNTTNKETINKIDNIITEINNIQSNDANTSFNADITIEISEIKSQIKEYQTLQDNNKLNPSQQLYLERLENKLTTLQKQLQNENEDSSRIPTVNDIVEQERTKSNSSNINLPPVKTDGNFNLKEAQNKIIQESNPVEDELHTWIRSVNDIKTFEETLEDSDYKEYYEAGKDFDETYSADMARKALETGKITVYSSYPIKQGIFVTPSKMEAQSYSGNGKVYSKEVKLTDVAWIDPTQGQYAKVKSTNLPVIDVTSVNNINQALMPIDMSQIRQVKGNIPIDDELLNKYSTVREMFDNEVVNYDGKINLNKNLQELKYVDLSNIKIEDLKGLARDIFYKYNSTNTFNNNGNIITVNNNGINESIEKIFNNRKQRNLLKEHLLVFSDLGDIVEHAKLSNQTDNKKKNPDINYWNYYLDGLEIKGKKYKLEFDVRSMQDGQNQYRVQRLELDEKKQADYDGDIVNALPPYSQSVKADTQSTLPINGKADLGAPAFSDNNITQSNENVKLPPANTNNMQNSENNSINMPPIQKKKVSNPIEISKLTKEDVNTTPILPTKTVEKGNGESKFASNIENKTNMLTDEIKDTILSEDEVKFYKEVTNKESLDRAFERLNKGGKSETLNWLNKKESYTSTDVAEGWILLKQYQDNIAKETDLIKKDELNRSIVQVAKQLRNIGTQSGQTVQAFNILNRLTPEGMVYYAQSELSEAYEKMSKNKTKEWIDSNRENFELTPDETQFIMDTMQEVQQMEDGYDKRVKLAEIQKLMTDKLPPAKGAAIRSWMRISMLFNPKTQVRNVAGNALIAPINYFGDMFSSYADKIISKKTGVRTTGNINVKAILKGMKQGAYEATNDYKKGINTKDMEGNRFEITDGKSFSERTLIGKGLNRTESLLNYVMDIGDRVFSQASFENSLQNQMILNNTTEITQDMIDIARSESLQRTWNDNNNYTRFVLSVRGMLNNIKVPFTNGYGLGDVLIPFAKTPANLTKAIVDYSPAGLVNTIVEGNNLRKAITNRQYTSQMQHKFVQDLGKATAGTMLYVLGYALARAGITSGESDDDKDTANFLKNALGISSYSIKIGNKSFTYDWAQPLAAPLSITANVVNSRKNKEQALAESIIGSLDTAGSILLEQSFLESLNDVLSSNDGVVSGIINEVLELPSRAVPTLSKQIADMVDGTQRQSFVYGKPLESAVNNIKAKIPFVSKTLAPSVDTMGREIKKYGGKNNIFNVFLNPANVNAENVSKSAKEIYRLYEETGETDIMPRVSPYYINQNGEKLTLNAEQRAEYQKVSGKIIEDSIEKLLRTSEYKNMSDEEKAEVINNVVNYSYNIAKKDVLNIELSNAYEKAYEYSQIGDISDYYSFKASIDDTDKDTKKTSITNFLIESNLNDEQLAYLYAGYYSNEETLNNIIKANIPIKEFIKFNGQRFENDYYDNGKAVTNSRKNKVINYVNSLNLSIPQKAILIKMEYSSYKPYDNQIVNYINEMNYSKLDKAMMLKQIGFDNYDKYIIDSINNQSISADEKKKVLEDLGFKVRNGKVYSK